MKIRHLLAGVLALSITAVSGASFADSRSHTYVDYPITNIPHHGQPRVNASIDVIDSEDLGSRPAMRVEHRGDYYKNRFEKRWGKDWKKKSHYKVIVVKPGDSLSKIAARYGTSVKRLMKLNNISAYEANHIEIGQMLRVA
ncbi:LysM peptidoglycan-binding domain-containing protein [uncultured Thiothrix sp.]|uniref:LysM peptidoglycan-binding domain-containing protein n=1 Tax=uncultured Thiothrix sp. TaxID=223185 RepID=UPI002611F553|nr:LysM peptidoglycan-binding domain-containing protein [uncultured Thiothrix sp.]